MPDSTIRGAMTGHRGLNGRRGVFLGIFAVIYVAIGISYIFPTKDSTVRHTMSWMPVWSPLWVCGLLWAAAGVIAALAAFRPLPQDRFGFEALAAVSWGWTVAYIAAWVLGDSSRGWVSALIFGLLGTAVITVSGMLNPPHGRIR